MSIEPTQDDKHCLKAIIEHWVEARIDGPMEALARYDDAAKHLITIGGVLQGGLVAVYSVLAKQEEFRLSSLHLAAVLIFEVTLIGFLAAAAWACSLQPEMQARQISDLLRKALEGCIQSDDLVGEVRSWCGDVEGKIRNKERLMLVSKILFILCTAVMSALLLYLPYAMG